MALAEAIDQGMVKPGSKIVFVAFGAGLTWGAAAYEWGDRAHPVETIDDELPEPQQSALDIIMSKQDALA